MRRPPRDLREMQTAHLRPWLYTTLSTIDSRELSRSEVPSPYRNRRLLSQGWRRTIYRSDACRSHHRHRFRDHRRAGHHRGPGVRPNGSIVNQALKRLIIKACDLVERAPSKSEINFAFLSRRSLAIAISPCAVRLPKGQIVFDHRDELAMRQLVLSYLRFDQIVANPKESFGQARASF